MLGEAARVERILGGAGYSELAFAPHRRAVSLGRTPEEATAFALELGALGQLVREAGGDAKERVAGVVREALAARQGPGGVLLDSASWIVTACA